MKYCIVNRSCIKFWKSKNCQLYKMFHKFVKSFKKLGLGTPPLKKREKRIVSFCYRICGFVRIFAVIPQGTITPDASLKENSKFIFAIVIFFLCKVIDLCVWQVYCATVIVNHHQLYFFWKCTFKNYTIVVEIVAPLNCVTYTICLCPIL